MDAQSALAALTIDLGGIFDTSNQDDDEPLKEELIPKGVTNNHPGRNSFPISELKGYAEAGQHHQSTFEVYPKHETLTNGVCFNVETVPEASEKHLRKPGCKRTDVIEHLQEEIAAQYNNERGVYWMECDSEDRVEAPDCKIEALSETQDQNVVHLGGDGFVMAVVTAFAQHLPLILSPDHVWMLIAYAFAKHVEDNSEELRKNFVQHEGKQRLEVDTPGGFAMSNGYNPDTGASAKEWESLVFPGFSSQIKTHIGAKTHEAVAGKFSTTTPTAGAAHEITLMSAMKSYFSFGMSTKCGIPNITLLGTEGDWVLLRERAEQLGSLMLPEFSDYWMPLLLPVLDEFVASYKGTVNHGFWQSMVKLRDTGSGSGSHDFISGWMQILFPYNVDGQLNRDLRPWHEMYFMGPEITDFPPLLSCAPVDWDYHGSKMDITFHAGVLGFTQDPTTGALFPLLGWYVSHAPPSSSALLQKNYEKEIEELLQGHQLEVASDNLDKNVPWYQRVQFLQSRVAELKDGA